MNRHEVENRLDSLRLQFADLLQWQIRLTAEVVALRHSLQRQGKEIEDRAAEILEAINQLADSIAESADDDSADWWKSSDGRNRNA